MFSIQLNETAIAKSPITTGKIVLGSFSETFESSLEFWKTSEYEAHWIRSIRELVGGKTKSCLITSISDPRTANFIFWWPIYVESEIAIFQNQILFLDDHRDRFDVHAPCELVRDRQNVSDNGEKISEWIVPIVELEEWLAFRPKK